MLPQLVQAAGTRGYIHVCVDDQSAAQLEEQIRFFAPGLRVLRFPAWDCLPYDRVSPSADIIAQRLATLAELARPLQKPILVLTTVNAILLRTVADDVVKGASWSAAPGQRVDSNALTAFLADNGYSRTGTVVDPGDYAVRGGLIDIYPPGQSAPVRLDFFGDTLESMRAFDPETQRTTEQLKRLTINPANEVLLNAESVALFRKSYAEAFGGIDTSDPLYESVTSARRYQGMEHWLPLFHATLSRLPDFLPDAVISLGHTVPEAVTARHEQIAEYYDARKEALTKQTFGAAPYKPLPPGRLFLMEAEWKQLLADRTRCVEVPPFERPEAMPFPSAASGAAASPPSGRRLAATSTRR